MLILFIIDMDLLDIEWIEKVGPHKGGHYALTKIGKKLCEKDKLIN